MAAAKRPKRRSVPTPPSRPPIEVEVVFDGIEETPPDGQTILRQPQAPRDPSSPPPKRVIFKFS